MDPITNVFQPVGRDSQGVPVQGVKIQINYAFFCHSLSFERKPGDRRFCLNCKRIQKVCKTLQLISGDILYCVFHLFSLLSSLIKVLKCLNNVSETSIRM